MTEDRIIGAARAIAEALGQDYDALPDFHFEPHRFCRDDFWRAALSAHSTGSGGVAAEPVAGFGIYMASKTAHALRWRSMRENGLPIISTWIDEAGRGETACFTDLWRRCVAEAASARALIVYREPDEVLKGAFVEVGAALAAGVPVYAVGCAEFNFVNHAGVTRCGTIEHALNCALAAAPTLPAGGGETERLREALLKIAELRGSEAGEPFDDALDIADAALAAEPSRADREETQAVRERLCPVPDRYDMGECCGFSPCIAVPNQNRGEPDA